MPETAQKIDKLEVTSDTLTSRGGLAFFVKYVEAIGPTAPEPRSRGHSSK